MDHAGLEAPHYLLGTTQIPGLSRLPDGSPPDGVLLAATVFAVLLMIRMVGGAKDEQILTGFGTVGVMAAAIGVTIALSAWDEGESWVRVLASLLCLSVALFCASTQWVRGTLRITASVCLFALGAVVFSVGQQALTASEGRSVASELRAATSQLSELMAVEDRARGISDARSRTVALLGSLASRAALPSDLAEATLGLAEALADPTKDDRVAVARARFDTALLTGSGSPLERRLARVAKRASEVMGIERAGVWRGDVSQAIATACSRAKAKTSWSIEFPCEEAKAGNVKLALAVMRLRLTQYRESVLAGEPDTLAAARQGLDKASGFAGPEEHSLPETLWAGAQAVVGDLPGQEPDDSTVLDLATWLVVVALALVGWQLIERRSGRQMPGPVRVEFTPVGGESEASKAAKERQAVFRTAVFKNVSEPSAAPGAPATAVITDLAELAPAVTGKWFQALTTALRSIFNAPRGYHVVVDAVPPAEAVDAPGSHGDWSILARLSDVTTGQQIAVREVRGATATDAYRAAGLWTAASVLERSTRIPRWAEWNASTCEALARYDRSDNDELDVAVLEEAVAVAPNSGLLLHKLADSYETAGRQADALGVYGRLVARHPDYLRGRYRLAVAVATISKDPDKWWCDLPYSKRVYIAQNLGRACEAIRAKTKPDVAALANAGDAATVQEPLQALAYSLYKELLRATQWAHLVSRAARRRERDYWLPLIGRSSDTYSPIHQWFWIPFSASLMVGAPTSRWPLHRKDPLARVEHQARNPRAWWQLSYNLACYHAQQDPPQIDTAVDWLVAAHNQPGAEQMTTSWLTTDPDLVPVQHDPRFTLLLASMRAGGRGAEDA